LPNTIKKLPGSWMVNSEFGAYFVLPRYDYVGSIITRY